MAERQPPPRPYAVAMDCLAIRPSLKGRMKRTGRGGIFGGAEKTYRYNAGETKTLTFPLTGNSASKLFLPTHICACAPKVEIVPVTLMPGAGSLLTALFTESNA